MATRFESPTDEALPMIEIVEVSPRDGLQNEQTLLSTEDKVSLIEKAIEAGARRIEATSFVNPKKVPQMADAESVMTRVPRRDDVTYIGLVLNRRGAERAIAAGVDELGTVCVASDEFAARNQGQSSAESLDIACENIALASREGLSAQITIAASFGCPYEGTVEPERVVEMAKAAAQAHPREIALADTIGVAVPRQVEELIGLVRREIGDIPLRAHFHNTRNTGIANVWAAVEAGVRTIDASLGGLGGCPFSPGASGNVATEDVAYMLERSGCRSNIDLVRAIQASHWLGRAMDKTLPSMVARAPAFDGLGAQG